MIKKLEKFFPIKFIFIKYWEMKNSFFVSRKRISMKEMSEITMLVENRE